MSEDPNERSRRRWLQFGMRTLLVAVTGLALVLAWWVNAARQQRRAVAAIRTHEPNAQIVYDYQVVVEEGDAPEASRRRVHSSAVSPVPTWLLRLFGDDFFHDVVELLVHEVDDALLENVAKLKSLERLTFLYGTATHRGIARLGKLRQLLSLNAVLIDLTDESLSVLVSLPRLQHLGIGDEGITDQGLNCLADARSLKSLMLGCETVTDQGVAHLAALTNLEELQISGRGITGAGFGAFASFKKLKRLELSPRNMNDDGLSRLAGLSGLESLVISSTKVTGEVAAAHGQRLQAVQRSHRA